MSGRCVPGRAGFTLIEVIGALLIFSGGVIMLLQLTSGLSRRLEHSAIESLMSVEGMARLDSMATLPYASLAVGADVDSLDIRGVTYARTLTVSQLSPLVLKLDVELTPATGEGPSFEATTYVAEPW